LKRIDRHLFDEIGDPSQDGSSFASGEELLLNLLPGGLGVQLDHPSCGPSTLIVSSEVW
jgi:hypothetical protein